MELIESLTPERVDWLDEQFAAGFYAKAAGYFGSCMEAQTRGELVLLLARDDEDLLGYVKVVW